MNCPISVVDVGSTRVAQARNSSIWRGDSRPVPPFRSNRTSASTPPSWNSLTQMRMVESSMNSASAIAAKDQPRSSSRMAFARRETRFSSSPSLAIATRSARSAALRKLRFVFTKRVESIPLIRSNDFRKNEESRYNNEADEQSGVIRRGAGGAKDGGQGESGPAKHVPGTGPGKRVTDAGLHATGRGVMQLVASYPRQEPDALIGPVRIRAGGAG